MARPAKHEYRPLMIEAAKRRLLAGTEVRITEIAHELEVSGPLVHYYFRDRQELVDVAWREILEAHVADDQREIVERSRDLDWDGVRGLVDRVFAPHRDGVHAAHLRAAVEALSSPQLAETVREVHETTISQWQQLVEAAIADGSAATTLDTRAVAMMVVGISLGITVVEPHLSPADRRNIAAAWTAMLRAVLDPAYQVPFPAPEDR